jgi:hypothetical protein
LSLQDSVLAKRRSLGGDEEEPMTPTSEPRTPTTTLDNFTTASTRETTTLDNFTSASNEPTKNGSSATKPKREDVPTTKCGSPKIQKHLSNVLSTKIGDSLSGYMEKISQKMKHDNMSVLSTESPERKRSKAQKQVDIPNKIDLTKIEENQNESTLNIYEFIDMPKLQPGDFPPRSFC